MQTREYVGDKEQTSVKQEPQLTGGLKSIADCCSDRQSAKAYLKDLIFRSKQKARDLEILFNMLPTELTAEQDSALWKLLSQK